MSNQIPEMSLMSFGDVYLFSYLLMSMIPMTYKESYAIGFLNKDNCQWVVLVFLLLSNIMIGVKWYMVSLNLNQEIPKQIKVTGGKKKPD